MMNRRELTEKVLAWCRATYPRVAFVTERTYQMAPQVVGISKPYFRADIVGPNKSGREVLGIGIKTLRDHNTFRKTATAANRDQHPAAQQGV